MKAFLLMGVLMVFCQGCATTNVTNVSPIVEVTIIDSGKLFRIQKKLNARRGPMQQKNYEVWNRYDTAIFKVLRKYGKVGSNETVDFYHSGDWHHELYNDFALQSSKALTTEALMELQKVVADHHPDAELVFEAALEMPFFGLRIVITSTTIYVAWLDEKADVCRANLIRFGIPID